MVSPATDLKGKPSQLLFDEGGNAYSSYMDDMKTLRIERVPLKGFITDTHEFQQACHILNCSERKCDLFTNVTATCPSGSVHTVSDVMQC